MSLDGRSSIIDGAKAIGITCIVLGHTYSPLRDFVYLFHVPLFVFLSGIFFRQRSNFYEFSRKLVHSLYIPFVLYGLSFLLLHNLFVDIGFYNQYFDLTGAAQQAIRILLFSIGDKERLLAATWFLKALFIITLIHYAISTRFYVKNNFLLALFSFLISATGYFIIKENETMPFLRVNVIVPALLLPFYTAGSMIGVAQTRLTNNKKRHWILAGAGIVFLCIALRFGTNDVISLKILPYFQFYLIATIGIITTLAISSLICDIKGVALIGKYSLGIMCLHFLSFKIPVYLSISYFGQHKESLSDLLGLKYNNGWVFCTAAGVILPIIILYSKTRIIEKIRDRQKTTH